VARQVPGQTSLLGYTNLASVVEDRIRRFIDEYRPRFIYVFFSGGKDSAAVLAAAASCCKDRVVAVFNHIVGQTHALNVQAALGVARKLGLQIRRIVPKSPEHLSLELARQPPRPGELLYLVVRSYRLGLDYWSAVKHWGFPAPAERFGKGVRWCCSEFKEKWWRDLPSNGLYEGKPAKYLLVGVKRSDSSYRRKKWKDSMVRVFRVSRGVDVALAPLADLSDADVWSLLRHYGVYDTVRKQYDVLGHSPNCLLCPLMNTEALRRSLTVLPCSYLASLRKTLSELRGRYSEGTFSFRVLGRWLSVLDETVSLKKCPVG